jgi:hypothetical protein
MEKSTIFQVKFQNNWKIIHKLEKSVSRTNLKSVAKINWKLEMPVKSFSFTFCLWKMVGCVLRVNFKWKLLSISWIIRTIPESSPFEMGVILKKKPYKFYFAFSNEINPRQNYHSVSKTFYFCLSFFINIFVLFINASYIYLFV